MFAQSFSGHQLGLPTWGIWPILNVIQCKWRVPDKDREFTDVLSRGTRIKKESYWAGGWERFVQVYSQKIESEMLESSASWVFYMGPSVGMFTKTPADQSAAPMTMCNRPKREVGMADPNARVQVNKNMWIALPVSMKDCVCQKYV